MADLDDLIWRGGDNTPVTLTGAMQDYGSRPPVQGTSLGLLLNKEDVVDGPADLNGIMPPGWSQAAPQKSARLDKVDPDHLTIKPAPVPVEAPGYILDQLARGEGTADDNPRIKSSYPSGSGYDAVYGYAATPKPESQITLKEVRQGQDGMPGPTPVGRYQINKATIDTLSRQFGLKGDETFSPDLQDRMARQRLVDRGWNDFRDGRITADQFGQKLTPVWSSLQDPGKMADFQHVLSQVPRGP